MTLPTLRVAIVGSGPAGIYAADALTKSDTAITSGVAVDIFERLPAPFGLIRYGVAPDHPRIKEIVTALEKVLDKPLVTFFGNVDIGSDLTLDDLHASYHAVILATGAMRDRRLDLPGVDLVGSYGAADFVSWYDGHPDVATQWPLFAERVAVLGVGNVALDVARILAKTADELLVTEIPANVEAGLRANQARAIHVFGRRGPAHAKFSPLELRELDHSPTIEVIVDPRDIQYDEEAVALRRSSKQVDLVCRTLEGWASREPGDRPHRLHLHFFEEPVEILGNGGAVAGLRTFRRAPEEEPQQSTWEMDAVYRAVGYRSEALNSVPFDEVSATIPNKAGRVQSPASEAIPGTYVTGWIKRGPVGLIGHTKGDANETVACLVEDFAAGRLTDPIGVPNRIERLLQDRGVQHTTWEGWYRLDAHERALGRPSGRARIKVIDRAAMVAISNDTAQEGTAS
ncbi:FAD-dependent oxidoreductase [Nocardioides sp. KC13]|uniref:ferredoxin--NADP(+) reductase n=1 Tax=Nocardioides turkmenicus TaxID=2711220 RepID=A0A6M1R5W9_9ACTN|nr:FAD-dependent oxidoreductase [Nocardioides sp. KC13]NGN91837.1 FAD-dependent oxidoreductase [Nocardioides sp. KC13]